MSELSYCKVSKKCSGCQLSNMDYNRQLKYKQNELRLTFSSLCKAEKIIGADCATAYRNKAQFVFKKLKGGDIACGIYQSADKTIVLTDSCALHTQKQNEVAAVLCRLFKSFKLEPYDLYRHRGSIKSVFVRQSFSNGDLMVVIVCDKDAKAGISRSFVNALVSKVPDIKSVIVTKHKGTTLGAGEEPRVVYGDSHITDKLCSLDFVISYNSFFQINPAQTQKLYSTAIEMADLNPRDVVLDAYCGTGTIGLVCAPHCKQVYSVEINKNAVADAKHNAKINNINNAEIVCADSEDYMEYLKVNGTKLSAAILDPPRAGCSKSFIDSLCSCAPEKIVYISCNIKTQARDLRILAKNGYSIEKIQGVDMFPYTKHIESIALLRRKV